MPDLDAERRAFEMLQWVPYSLPTDFDEELAAQGHYTRLQRQRSNDALASWDKQHPCEQSDELAAFQYLEWLGIYTQHDLFSPTKAKDGYYTRRLSEHQAARKPQGISSAIRATGKLRRKGPL